jgi:hypothetical protein
VKVALHSLFPGILLLPISIDAQESASPGYVEALPACYGIIH